MGGHVLLGAGEVAETSGSPVRYDSRCAAAESRASVGNGRSVPVPEQVEARTAPSTTEDAAVHSSLSSSRAVASKRVHD
jgi:hypothetical protein